MFSLAQHLAPETGLKNFVVRHFIVCFYQIELDALANVKSWLVSLRGAVLQFLGRNCYRRPSLFDGKNYCQGNAVQMFPNFPAKSFSI